ncbi:hypothetical protein [Kitasatospora sp. NPDC002965]|uniref:hypothetical protein n=1 Tax=Kitasatospora sp. NPDC002965 TaxID=3154775 RepID=UPI0033B41122
MSLPAVHASPRRGGEINYDPLSGEIRIPLDLARPRPSLGDAIPVRPRHPSSRRPTPVA